MPAGASASRLTRGSLTALQLAVERMRNEQTRELNQNESVELVSNDRIAVGKNGRALVTFEEDGLAVELFRDTQIRMDVHPQPAGFPLLQMFQLAGYSEIKLKNQVGGRFELITSIGAFRATEPDTDFIVCHKENVVTCLVVFKGAVEMEAQGQVATAQAGTAGYILAGQPPLPPVCANLAQVHAWLDSLRSNSEEGDLGAIVMSWPQVPCDQVAASSPAASALTAAQPTADVATPIASTVEATNEANPAVGQSTARTVPAPEDMVAIAGGHYIVGNDVATDAYHLSAQSVELAPFWIDETEATNAQYAAYLAATGAAAPAAWMAGQLPPRQEQYPAHGLTWNDADAYCRWAGKRLPTEEEWEAAARGQTERATNYPWGDDPTAGGQTAQLPLTMTYPVGAYEFNRSPAGAYDMIGNVWEWVGEPYAPVAADTHVLHGGRYGLLRDIGYRQTSMANDTRFVEYAGVRCAADQ